METFVTIIATIIFCKVQVKRQDERLLYEKYEKQPFFIQSLVSAIIICICVFGACATSANVDTQFLYFQF